MMGKDRLDIDIGHLQVAAEPAEHVHEGIGFRLFRHDVFSPLPRMRLPSRGSIALACRVSISKTGISNHAHQLTGSSSSIV